MQLNAAGQSRLRIIPTSLGLIEDTLTLPERLGQNPGLLGVEMSQLRPDVAVVNRNLDVLVQLLDGDSSSSSLLVTPPTVPP